MPVYNFQHRFAGPIVKGLMELAWEKGGEALSMEQRLWDLAVRFNVDQTILPKRQTIRLPRKRPTLPGDKLIFYTGLRTKVCIKLGEAICQTVSVLRLSATDAHGIYTVMFELGDGAPVWQLDDSFAQRDGFQTADEMMNWFQKTHGLPFMGELITW